MADYRVWVTTGDEIPKVREAEVGRFGGRSDAILFPDIISEEHFMSAEAEALYQRYQTTRLLSTDVF